MVGHEDKIQKSQTENKNPAQEKKKKKADARDDYSAVYDDATDNAPLPNLGRWR